MKVTNPLVRWLLAALVAAMAGPAGAGVITNSAHDFTKDGTGGWNLLGTNGPICAICHTPHKADSTNTALWTHANTTQNSYTLYSSTTMKASLSQPGPSSKLCLSCHDGSIAVDSFGGNTGTHTISTTSRKNLGAQALNDDHPIGFTYDSALATSNGSLFDPSSKVVTIGASPSKSDTITSLLLYAGKMECSSCHDVHNTFTVGANGTGMVKISTSGSAICLACHNK